MDRVERIIALAEQADLNVCIGAARDFFVAAENRCVAGAEQIQIWGNPSKNIRMHNEEYTFVFIRLRCINRSAMIQAKTSCRWAAFRKTGLNQNNVGCICQTMADSEKAAIFRN